MNCPICVHMPEVTVCCAWKPAMLHNAIGRRHKAWLVSRTLNCNPWHGRIGADMYADGFSRLSYTSGASSKVTSKEQPLHVGYLGLLVSMDWLCR